MPTVPRQFRLTDATLADLDRIARHLGAVKPGGEPNRAAAIRAAAADYLRRLPDGPAAAKKPRKKT